MAAPKGNKFWQLRSKHGRDKLFKTPELLWEAACEYFKWCDENPLLERKAFAYQGVIITEDMPRMRAYTIHGLTFYLNCNTEYFRRFKAELKEKDKDFCRVIKDIEETIFRQKFEGAACDLLNANIISRDLGLADKQDVTTDGDKISNVPTIIIKRK